MITIKTFIPEIRILFYNSQERAGKASEPPPSSYVFDGDGINNVEKIVRSVLTDFTSMDNESLQKPIFAILMFTKSRILSQLQVAETFESCFNTLHADIIH